MSNPKQKLLLIVLTNTVRNKSKEYGFDDSTLADELNNLCEIQLFHLRRHSKKQDNKNSFIALPISNGKHVLLLTKNDMEDYFVCVDFCYRKEIDQTTDHRYCYEFSNKNIGCELFVDPKRIQYYQADAINHGKVWDEVCQKKEWHPYQNSNAEEEKWSVYLRLHKKIIDKQKVEFDIKDISIKQEKLVATVTDPEKNTKQTLKKITDARGEDIHGSIISPGTDSNEYPLGKLQSIRKTKIEIVLESNNMLYEKFEKSLKNQELELEDNRKIQHEYVQNNQNSITEKTTFYQRGHPLFTAKAIIRNDTRDYKAEEDYKLPTYKIIANSIQPHKISCSINYSSDEYQIKVMKDALKKVTREKIWKVLSGERVAHLPNMEENKFDFPPMLNAEQKKAVEGALSAPELFLIWGPPGTGKTEVIKEIAKQEALRGKKTLICSQSNLAVDNALARLADTTKVYPFRIAKQGYKMEGEDIANVPFKDSSPGFFVKSLQKKLREKNEETINTEVQRNFLKRLDKSKKMLSKNGKSDIELREFYQFARLYRKRINIVGSTLMGAVRSIPILQDPNRSDRSNRLPDTVGIKEFDTIIIDEVSKATPPELFIPIPLGERLILVGDHKQLPPMFKMLSGDDRAQEEWAQIVGINPDELDVDNTIFQRLWERHSGNASSVRAMLTKQYRMHPDIQKLIEQFYKDEEGELTWGGSDINKFTLQDPFFKDRPAMWIGTKRKSNGHERKEGTSYANDDEIEKVGKLLEKLALLKDKSLSVGVITFYGAQLKELKYRYEKEYQNKFGEGKLIFGTVDRFQGRECDVIICSLVRNNEARKIGFAKKPNRINVAFSRARKALIILGSREQFCYETENEDAKLHYKYIYNNCHRLKPKELK